MRMAVIGTLPNMKLADEFKRMKFSLMNLEKSGSQVSLLKKNRVKDQIGTIGYDSANNSPCFYLNMEVPDNQLDYSNELHTIRSIYQRILFSFWLVKDHSLHSDIILGVSESGLSINKSPVTFVNSKGYYTENYFSKEEIVEAESWFIKELAITEKKPDYNRPKITIGSMTTYTTNSLPYFKADKLDRANRFILLARSESFLPGKLTFYISALESLLSNSNVELRMQVADRVARILGSSYEERVRINRIISIAYTFRSNYIHGSVSSEKTLKRSLKFLDSVEELSTEVDEILRRIIKRFLTDLNHVIKMDDEHFSIWLNELLYR
ncbi:HEPN domain-containing protein [Planococcus versutus]|uniref:Uncharacterized protein n=1 Tax=Planococcus versutus TaxID=1302659 RepID=A0A1B1S5K9_9BACL|nr:HEPN domain-containing protein [Planococcus versutus]ANU28465.1 hypothetical protein I858_015860 [Planococcus versutus]